MANYKAIGNGNFNNLAIWQDDSTGSYQNSTVLPSLLDNVYANNYVINVNVDTITNTIRSTSATNVTVGGYFEINSDVDLTAINGFYGRNTSASPIDITKVTVIVTGVCTTTITGEQTGVVGTSAVICINANANVTIIGNGYSTGIGGYAIWNTATANLSVVDIAGNHKASDSNTSASYCIYNQGDSATIKHNGTRTGGLISTTANAFNNAGANAIIELSGEDVLRNASASVLTGFASLKLNTIIDGHNSAVNINVNNKTFTLSGSIRGNTSQAIAVGTGTTVIIDGCELNYYNGIPPILPTLFKMLPNIANKFCFPHPISGDAVCIYDELNQPIESDVRDGVTYVSRTGSLKVAPPSLVVKDVPTDATVGTWAFDSALISSLENAVTEQYLTTELGNLTI